MGNSKHRKILKQLQQHAREDYNQAPHETMDNPAMNQEQPCKLFDVDDMEQSEGSQNQSANYKNDTSFVSAAQTSMYDFEDALDVDIGEGE